MRHLLLNAVLGAQTGYHIGNPFGYRSRHIRFTTWKRIGKHIGLRIGLRIGKQIGLRIGKQIGLRIGKRIGLRIGKRIGKRIGLGIGVKNVYINYDNKQLI